MFIFLSYGSSFVHINEDKGKETLGMVCLHLLWNVPNQSKRTSKIRRCWIKGIFLCDKKLALSYTQVFEGGSLVFISATIGNKKALVKPWTCCIFSEDWLYLKKTKQNFQLLFLFSTLVSEKDLTVISGAICWKLEAIADWTLAPMALQDFDTSPCSLPLVTEDLFPFVSVLLFCVF